MNPNSVRQAVRGAVEDQNSPAGRRFDLTVQAVILLWVVAYSIDTLPDNPPAVRSLLGGIEIVVSLLFTLEYLLRIYAAQRPVAFLFSFWGLVDLISILPFYLSLAPELRSMRVLRLLRLFRVLKLGRFNRALQRLKLAAEIARDEFLMFLLIAMLLIFLAAAGIHHFENEAQPDKFESIFSSLWWAVATLTTVGYGDVYPITAGGRVFTFLILMVGLGIVAVPTGLVTSALAQARDAAPQDESEEA